MPEPVLYAVENHVATLTIDRPKERNALNGAVLEGLLAGLRRAEEDGEVRAIVLTGAGERAFCAGADLGESFAGGAFERHDAIGTFADALERIYRSTKPTVARVNGAALGGGFGLALACDLTIAADDVELGTPEVHVGLFPMMIMTLIFRICDRKQAMRMVMTGERLTAARALAMGAVTEVVPRAELDAAVARACSALTSKSPATLRLGKEAFLTMEDMTVPQAFHYLRSMLTLNTLTEDATEGLRAFGEKRTPEWKGR
jgi:enoyl-CoA hydratase/carnithine racemase